MSGRELPEEFQLPGIRSYVAKGEPTKSGRGPTISKTSPTLGSRQEDSRPASLAYFPPRDRNPKTIVQSDVSPLHSVLEVVSNQITESNKQNQQMLAAMMESQRQFMSTMLSGQQKSVPKPPQLELSDVNSEQLLEMLLKTDNDDERIKIRHILSERLKAGGTVRKQDAIESIPVPSPKFTSTPECATQGVKPLRHVINEASINVDGASVSVQADIESPRQQNEEGKMMSSNTPIGLGARPKTTTSKRDVHISDDLTDDDRPSLEDTVGRSFSSTAANRGSQNSLSIPSSEEKSREVSFVGEKWKSCLKSPRRGRAYSRERASSNSPSPSPSQRREDEAIKKGHEKPRDENRSQGIKRGRDSPPPSDPDSDKDKKGKGNNKKPDRDDKQEPDKNPPSPQNDARTPSPSARKNTTVRQWAKIETYDGSTPWPLFDNKFRNACKFFGWDETEKLSHLVTALKGQAAQVIWDNGADVDTVTFAELYNWVKTRFDTEGQRSRYKAELSARKRRKGETLQSLSSDIARLMGMAYRGEKSAHRDDMAVDRFLAALDDEELKLKVMECEPKSLDEAVKNAQRFESYKASIEGANADGQAKRRNQDNYQARAVTNNKANQNNNGALAKLVQSDENTQNKIQTLEKLSESTYNAVQELRQGISGLQLRALTPAPPPASQIPLTAAPAPPVPIPSFHPGPTSPMSSQMNMGGYQYANTGGNYRPPAGAMHGTVPYGGPPMVGSQNAPNPMGRGGAGRGTPPQCYGCGNFGHIKRNCPTPVGYGGNNSPPSNQGNQPLQNMMVRAGKRRVAVVQCFGCGSYGHVRKDCVSNPRPSPLMETKGGQIYNGQNYANPDGTPRGNDQTFVKCQEVGADGLRKNKSYLEIEIGGNKHMCLLDSGSDVTIVPMSIVHGRRLTRTTQKLFAAGGHKLPLSGTTTITMKIGDQTLETGSPGIQTH